jgi:hypothetical protein
MVSTESFFMQKSGCVGLFLIFCLFVGLVVCAGCTRNDSANPLVTGTPGVPGPSGQPGPAATMGTCLPPQVWCNGRCADLSAERENCGTCGALCPEGKICRNTQCVSGDGENPGIPGIPRGTENPGTPVILGTPVMIGTTPAVPGTPVTTSIPGSPSCSSGQTNCYGTCTDLQSDATHCGACNIKCASGKLCSAGSCTISCSAGQTNCGGSCTNTQTSSQHCGKCNNPCSSGQTCQNGKCGLYMSVITLDPHEICINSGHSWCWGVCSDLQTDENNCGSCGTKCPSGKLCSAGKCVDWSGSWALGTTTLQCTQKGTSVTCTLNYYGDQVTLSGTTSGSPPILTGTCTESGSTNDTGTFEFDMSADGKQFTGHALWKATGTTTFTYTRK